MFSVKAIIPDSPAISPNLLMEAVNAALDESAKEVQGEFETTVETWNEKPVFRIVSGSHDRSIFTEHQIYDWVNNGTMPHAIFPVNKLALFFAIDSSPKTRMGMLGSAPGNPGTNFVFSYRGVYNPGVAPRGFDRVIWERWIDILPTRIQAAIDRVT